MRHDEFLDISQYGINHGNFLLRCVGYSLKNSSMFVEPDTHYHGKQHQGAWWISWKDW